MVINVNYFAFLYRSFLEYLLGSRQFKMMGIFFAITIDIELKSEYERVMTGFTKSNKGEGFFEDPQPKKLTDASITREVLTSPGGGAQCSSPKILDPSNLSLIVPQEPHVLLVYSSETIMTLQWGYSLAL
ncbi:unnamed protein product [Rhizophagus irregularis]|nr:unnamed protein product [Rhizophagus irregularis]